ncbi:uncharacterized protein K452DRAFT_362767 [Aplosporella prunicola CBS 121167]|uniref:BED-type domain-containing protein n=1 Tax=Aplosporella prunicola CBS 121167 TaxID=1176127 RepID=A0A6A6AVN5_9PEZI|nr:uncharacterized protein K452DRAFT_362767 [Aplosporella prunicola CBS 121167]KAF2136072.1 hypothetical protein K452DRAFT_362767 [Aplosporella prunicola CBS 121167]
MPFVENTPDNAITASSLTSEPSNITELHRQSDLSTSYTGRLRDADGSVFNPTLAAGFTMVPLTPLERRKRRSHIWEHGFLPTNIAKDEYWLCKQCHTNGRHKAYKLTTTSHSTKHIRVHVRNYRAGSTPAEEPSRRINKIRYRARAVEWTVLTNQTFRGATHPSHLAILQSVAEDINPCCSAL